MYSRYNIIPLPYERKYYTTEELNLYKLRCTWLISEPDFYKTYSHASQRFFIYNCCTLPLTDCYKDTPPNILKHPKEKPKIMHVVQYEKWRI
jgi:hypothetical protein